MLTMKVEQEDYSGDIQRNNPVVWLNSSKACGITSSSGGGYDDDNDDGNVEEEEVEVEKEEGVVADPLSNMETNLSKNADWNAVRNHTAFRAERSLGHIAWGRGEADVYIMRDCCVLLPDTKTIPKLSIGTRVRQCSWPDCDAYMVTDMFISRHLLVKHLTWPTTCAHCNTEMRSDISRHKCRLQCPYCRLVKSSKENLALHVYSEHGAFYCELCEQTLQTLSEMKAHILQENRGLVQSCILCKRRFKCSDGVQMRMHLLQYHTGLKITQNNQIELLDHPEPNPVNRLKPADPGSQQDWASGEEQADPQLITSISMRYRPRQTETYQFDNFKCPHCSRLFSARSGLKIHVGIAHRGETVIFCPRCPLTFMTVTQTKAHLINDHSGQQKGRKRSSKPKTTIPAKSRSIVPTDVAMTFGETVRPGHMEEVEDERVCVEDERVCADDERIHAEDEGWSEMDEILSCNNLNRSSVRQMVDSTPNIKVENPADQSLDRGRTRKAQVKTEVITVSDEDSAPLEDGLEAEGSSRRRRPVPGLLKINSAQVLFTDRMNEENNPLAQSEVSQQKTQVSLLKRKADETPDISEPNSKRKATPEPKTTATSRAPKQRLSTKLKELKRKMMSPKPLVPILPKQGGPPVVVQARVSPLSSASSPSGSVQRNVDISDTRNSKALVTVGVELTSASKHKVYIPVVGKDGKTVLMDLEEAKNEMNLGTIQFLPSGLTIQPTSSTSSKQERTQSFLVPAGSAGVPAAAPLKSIVSIQREGSNTKIVLEKRRQQQPLSSTAAKEARAEEKKEKQEFPEIVSVSGATPESDGDIMRDKVALNLPVVLTRRTNKKLAQDNPFFEVSVVAGKVYGTCRICQLFGACFSQQQEMIGHFLTAHQQNIGIKRFGLFYEISFRNTARSKKKYFLCYYCGKEFTTKFNVRRHQMLYCPQKHLIDPRLLGLGPRDGDNQPAGAKYGSVENTEDTDTVSLNMQCQEGDLLQEDHFNIKSEEEEDPLAIS